MDAEARAAVIAAKRQRILSINKRIARLLDEAESEQAEIEILESPDFDFDAKFLAAQPADEDEFCF